jgi:geranylgeranyl reductase
LETFDVIIVGGGPAGLECARELSRSKLQVLLLEKNAVFGDKLCAGGITLKDMEVLPLPDFLIQQRIFKFALHSRRRTAETVTPHPFVFTLDRQEMGAYHRSLLDDTEVVVRTRSQVTEIGDHKLKLKTGEEFGFRFLVGADGYASVVRRHLRLKVHHRLMGLQYTLPVDQEYPKLEMFLDARKFHSWYAWIFPHSDSIAVGCCWDPRRITTQKVKRGFHEWLEEKSIDTGQSILESCPIACDYQGYQFGNTFLVGEAAGLASGFTGEGIYQALVSGREVARMIMDPAYIPSALAQVLKYNRTLRRLLAVFQWAGPLRGTLQEIFLYMMNRAWVREKINSLFS